MLKALLGAASSRQQAADLQEVYCEGSLLNRFCTPAAVIRSPAAVEAFLVGLKAVAEGLTTARVDIAPLKDIAGCLDRAVAGGVQNHGCHTGEQEASGPCLEVRGSVTYGRSLASSLPVLITYFSSEALRNF